MEEELTGDIKFENVPLLEFMYQKISVEAKIEKEVPDGKGGYKKQKIKRTILKEASGKFEPKTMTAILGPSGSGKTTMLNLLSGRLLSQNLTLRGRIIINGKKIRSMSDYKNVIGYVMQEDLMLATFTPRETFRFIADMKLAHKTDQEKNELVQNMIDVLGLKRCSNTYIGNSLVRGLSGGERKRTSVGVELLVNPSLIFLDEPTTGLDSTTALNLIRFLNRLANAGRTVVMTIHQPSSEIFLEFDQILLMLDGNIVYHNRAVDSMKYFANLGLPVPPRSNPMDHYMKLMNKEGISLAYIEQGKSFTEEDIDQEFKRQLERLVTTYKSHEVMPISTLSNEIHKEPTQASYFTQVGQLMKRSVINQLRNPLGIRAKLGQMIFFGIVTIILYQRQSIDLDSYIQNTMGLLYFIVMNTCFSAIFNSINIFSQERGVFIRERLSNTYQTSSYFIAKSTAELPVDMFLPFLMVTICYFAVHLDNDGSSYILTLASCWLATWMASAYGLVLSTAFKQAEVALSLIPVLIIPLLLIGGFFAPLDKVPEFFRVFEYIAVFKYQYQTIVYAQFFDDREGFSVTLRGVPFKYEGDILSTGRQMYFEQPFWLSMFLMGIIGLALRFIALGALYLISNPKKLKLKEPEASSDSQKSKDSAKQLVDPNMISNEAINPAA